MTEDTVLQEVRAAREAYARLHGYDVRAIVADLRAQDERGDRPVVRLSPRPPIRPVLPRPQPGSTARRPRAVGSPADPA